MVIVTSAVVSILLFTCGIVIGIYIMTQIDNKRESQLVNQLLELEDNIRNLLHLKDAYKNNQCTCKGEKK